MPPTQRPEAQSRLCHRDRAGPSGAAAENRPAHRALRVPSGVCSFIFIKVFCVLSCFSLKTRHQAGGARTSAPGGADAVAVTSKPSHVPATKAKWWPQTPAVCGVSAQPGRSTADARSLIRPHPGRRGGVEPEQLPAWPLCCPCLCRPPSCCGAVAGERPVAKLGHGVLTPSSSAASRPWRMGGSESRGKETLGRGSGEGTLRARAPPAPARTLWRSEARIRARDPFSRVGGFSLFCPVPSPEP